MKKDIMKCVKKWFVVHFIVDLVVAIPLMIAPELVLNLVGMDGGSVVLARIVAAALVGIGIESYLGRNTDKNNYMGMLRLKIIWSGAVILGMILSLINNQVCWWVAGPLLGVFGFFNIVWIYWFINLKKEK